MRKTKNHKKKPKLFCDMCLGYSENPYAAIHTADDREELEGEEGILYFCSEGCYYKGLSELLYDLLCKFNGSGCKEMIDSIWLTIDTLMEPSFEAERFKEIHR